MSTENPGSISAASAAARISEPSWVRNGTAKVQQEYALGLEFEQMLLQQLASSVTATGEPLSEGTEGSGGEAATGGGASSVLSNMIPTALAEGVAAGGGLGLAAELTRQMQAESGARTSVQTQPYGAQGGVEADVSGGTHA